MFSFVVVVNPNGQEFKLKIISWNVNGIRAVSKKGFYEFVEREKADVLCIQETKAHKEQLDKTLIEADGCLSFWSSAEKKGYSGVSTYLRKSPDEVSFGLGVRKFDSEGRFVITEVDGILIYNIYFPNGSASEIRHDYKQSFLKKLNSHLKKQLKINPNIIVLGDYNVAHQEQDVHDPVRLKNTSGFLPEERKWFDSFLNLGFIDSFRHFYPNVPQKYSWWSYREMARTANKGWRLDYICVSEALKSRMKSATIYEGQLGSDHCPVLLELK